MNGNGAGLKGLVYGNWISRRKPDVNARAWTFMQKFAVRTGFQQTWFHDTHQVFRKACFRDNLNATPICDEKFVSQNYRDQRVCSIMSDAYGEKTAWLTRRGSVVWPNARAWKARLPQGKRGFESRPLRQNKGAGKHRHFVVTHSSNRHGRDYGSLGCPPVRRVQRYTP